MAKKHRKKSSATATVLKDERARFVSKSSSGEFGNKQVSHTCSNIDKDGDKIKNNVEKSKNLHSGLKEVKIAERLKENRAFDRNLIEVLTSVRKKIKGYGDKFNLHRIRKEQKPEKESKRFYNNKNGKFRKVIEELIAEVYGFAVGLSNLKKSPNYHEIVLKTKIFAALVGMICIIFIINNMPTGYKKAYAVVLNNKVVGYLKDKSEAENLMTEIAKEVEQKHSTDDFKLQNQLQLKSIEPGEYRETNIDFLKNNIIENGKVLIKRYALFVDSKAYFIFQDENTPKKILEQLRSIYYKQNSSSATFKEKIDIKPVYVSPSLKLATESDALNKIMFGKDQILEYTIKEGDTLWELSNKYNISVDDIFASNPGLSEKIMPGQKIRLTKATPLINVILTKEVEYEDILPKQVKVIKSPNYYTTQTIVKQDGQDGRAKIKAKIVYMNGLEYDRQIISKKIIKNPVERVVVVGTKKPPAYFATGRFSYPVWGLLTSRYGYRGREFHPGIDIAVPWGSNVYAADGGEVEFTGWSGGYGKLIIINHKNGYQTYYGHLSKILVYPGQKIVKGQIIAKSGSTGRSTGPHLHFEVRKNGVTQNPLRYLQ